MSTVSTASSIRSKIATFEAQNESRRRSASVSSSTGGAKDPSPTSSPAWRKKTGKFVEDSPARSVSSIDGGGRRRLEALSMQQPQLTSKEPPAAKASPTLSTAAASQNRISRIRQQQQQVKQQHQQQQAKEGTPHNNNSKDHLLEKRKQMKERLMLQKNHRAATKSRTPSPTATAATPQSNNIKASPSPSSLKRKVELARRTKYQTQQHGQASPEPTRVDGNSKRIVTPGEASSVSSKQKAMQYDSGEDVSFSSSSPNRATNRLSMMQRVHKMKGKDHVKRAKEHKQPRPSVADSSVTSASAATTTKSTATAATTAIADRNLSSSSKSNSKNSNYSASNRLKQQQAEPDHRRQQQQQQQHQPRSHHHERRRKELQERRKSDQRYRQAAGREESHSPVPQRHSQHQRHHHLSNMIGDEMNPPLSPTEILPHDNSFSHIVPSPRSGTDVMSEGNFDANASLDHVTDDEATLTSVRRVMARGDDLDRSPPHGSSMSRPRYQHLMSAAESPRTEVSADDPVSASSSSIGKGMHHHALHHRHGSSIKNSRSGEDYNMAISSPTNGGGSKSKSGDNSSARADRSYKRGESRRREWINEEKSDKGGSLLLGSAGGGGVFQTTSSSDYDTDGDISKTSKASRRSNPNLEGPSNSQTTDITNDFFTRSKYAAQSRKVDDDDKTFDYGDRDDDSAGSYVARRRREKERRAREAAAAATAAQESVGMEPEADVEVDDKTKSPLINKDDVEHYTGSLDDPMTKVGIGVVGCVTIGCMVMGPICLLVGAAAVGVGVGVMQIPEEKREKMQSKAQKKISAMHEKAMEATDTLSNSCGAAYNDSGMAEHLPQCLPPPDAIVETDVASARSEKIRGTASDAAPAKGGAVKPTTRPGQPTEHEMPTSPTPSTDRVMRNKKVACLRNVGILPASQIHGLDPTAQPRAWLDVVASANTTSEEKIEAIEEILILAKDKRRARIFLDEGILDWIVWTLSRYFEKINAVYTDVTWANPDVTPTEKNAAKLAAMCCVTLGKAHCAAIHTEGDLLLMSLYERGTVPEVRQVAQMLHEVPHHVRITKTPDPTIIDPSKEVFSLRQLTLPQAEDLARSVMEVANGRL